MTQIKVRAHVVCNDAHVWPCHSTQEYESIYKAGLAVQKFPQQRVVSTRRKREDDDDDDDDIRYATFVRCTIVSSLTSVHHRDQDRKRILVDDDDEDDAMQS